MQTAVEPYKEHHLRKQLNEQMHQRQFPNLKSPFHMLHYLIVMRPLDQEVACNKILDLAKQKTDQVEKVSSSCFRFFLGSRCIHIEKHTEFITCTFIAEKETQINEKDAESWLRNLQGEILRSVKIDCLSATAPMPSEDFIRNKFNKKTLVSSFIARKKAQIWTDFQRHHDGFGYLLVKEKGLDEIQLSRVVHALLEIGNYRKMSLISVPEANRLLPNLRELESRLAQLIQVMSANTYSAEHLRELTELAQEAEQEISDTEYRFSATRAYFNIVMNRLDTLEEQEIPGFDTLAIFTSERLGPILETTGNVAERLYKLSERIARVGDILRTRINHHLEEQNNGLLSLLNERMRKNSKLQAAVENLSVIAASYYALGIIGMVLEAADKYMAIGSPTTIKGLLAPVIVLGFWACLQSVKRNIDY